MLEFTAKSGAQIVINEAPWKDAKALKKAIERELANCNMADFIKTALIIDSSEAIDAAIWPCLIRCTRDSVKITEQVFDKIEARQDYHEIVVECARVNIGPLVESLSFQLEKLGLLKKKQENIPPSI